MYQQYKTTTYHSKIIAQFIQQKIDWARNQKSKLMISITGAITIILTSMILITDLQKQVRHILNQLYTLMQ